MMPTEYLKKTQEASKDKLLSVKRSLDQATELVQGKACVYATGSYGRLEAGKRSDLDLFIVSEVHECDDKDTRALSGIDEIKLQYFLIKAVGENDLPEFDGDGKYLGCHTFEDYVKHLGGPEDDAKNTMTGRLLLLLESKPLIGADVYERLIRHVLTSYFRDFKDNPDNFVPAFLFNDILRMWRTFCVNYEHRRKKGSSENKIKNLKLKYSRMLTCYSALIFLLDIFARAGTVTPDDVFLMTSKTPTERMTAVKEGVKDYNKLDSSKVESSIQNSLDLYSQFLQFTHQEKRAVLNEFAESQNEWKEKSYEFGHSMELAMSSLGRLSVPNSDLYRMILI